MDYEYYATLKKESDKLEYLAKVDREKKAKEEARVPKHVTKTGEVITFKDEAEKLVYLMKNDVKIEDKPKSANMPNNKKFDLANMSVEEINANWDAIKEQSVGKLYK